MKAGSWRASDEDVARIVAATHDDPFSILGLHSVPEGMVIRAFVPSVARLQALIEPVDSVLALERRGESDFFEALVPDVDRALRLPASRRGKRRTGGSFSTPTLSAPVLGPLDDHLLVEGTHKHLYERLGAHPITHEGVDGILFAVWAPQAQRVSVVGDFNQWDGRRHTMRKRVDSGLWELFAPGLGEGTVYKYEIIGVGGNLVPLKADPFGFGSELRPSTASIVARTDNFTWGDEEYMAWRSTVDARRSPMSIYEVHLGSWRRGWDNSFLSYDELAEQLIPYAVDMGFTHLELLPISEHPLDASWGYQPIGLFAPTRRHGDPAGFQRFVDAAHRAGLGVILDWVPAHFPTDEHGLAWFDGAALYEHPDPRRGFHPDWNTAIYDFGRREVSSVLISNAPLLARPLPYRRLSRGCGRLHALPRLFETAGRVAAQFGRREREPRRRALPAIGQRERLWRLPWNRDGGGGVDILAGRLSADQQRRAWVRLQVEHGVDERHAHLHDQEPGLPAVAP